MDYSTVYSNGCCNGFLPIIPFVVLFTLHFNFLVFLLFSSIDSLNLHVHNISVFSSIVVQLVILEWGIMHFDSLLHVHVRYACTCTR